MLRYQKKKKNENIRSAEATSELKRLFQSYGHWQQLNDRTTLHLEMNPEGFQKKKKKHYIGKI